ncbi:MAG: hypothetical protein R2876_03555 [Eubacteriales bacterium]
MSEQERFEASDIEQNKVMAVLSYLGILVLVPILAAPNSKFARFHANQGLIVAIIGVAAVILFAILYNIAWATLSLGLVTVVSILSYIVWIGIVVLEIIGIINAAQGTGKALPLVGSIKILK